MEKTNNPQKSEPCAAREDIVCDDPNLILCVLERHSLKETDWIARIGSFMQGTNSNPTPYTLVQLEVPMPCKDWLIKLTYGLSQRHDDIYAIKIPWPTPTPVSASGCCYYSYVLFNALQTVHEVDRVEFYKGHEEINGQVIVAALFKAYSGDVPVYWGDLTSQIPLISPIITVP